MNNILTKIKNHQDQKILSKKGKYVMLFKNDNILTITENDKTILVAKYIFFGIYQIDTKFWIWSSSIPGVNQKQIKYINSIKNKNNLFENDDNEEIMFLYQLLTENIIKIDKLNIELINKTLAYLSNSILVLNPINKYNNIQFIGITKILEKYI
jgi:hypothetical protein